MMAFSFSLLSDRLDNMMAALQSFSHVSTEKHADSMSCDRPSTPRRFRYRARTSVPPESTSLVDVLEPVAQHQWQDYATKQSSLTTLGSSSECCSLSATTDHSTIVASESFCSPQPSILLSDKILPKIADFDFLDGDTSYTAPSEPEHGHTPAGAASSCVDDHTYSEDPVFSYDTDAWPEYPTPLSPPPFRLRRPRSRIVMIPDDEPENLPQRKRSSTGPSSPRRIPGPRRFEF